MTNSKVLVTNTDISAKLQGSIDKLQGLDIKMMVQEINSKFRW